MQKKYNKGSVKGLLLVFGLPILFLIVVGTIPYTAGLLGFDYVYSEGIRNGQVLKLSEKGLIWKTYEGSLGVTQSGAYVENWNFSIDNQEANKNMLIQSLSEALKNGHLVEIKYSQRIGIRPWRAKTSYLVKEISIVR